MALLRGDTIIELLDELDKAVDVKVYSLMKGEQLNPDAALQAWAEKLAYYQLRTRLVRVERQEQARISQIVERGT